jgi:hypothetical protein
VRHLAQNFQEQEIGCTALPASSPQIARQVVVALIAFANCTADSLKLRHDVCFNTSCQCLDFYFQSE